MTEQNEQKDQPKPGEQLVLNSPDEAKSLKDFALWAGVILLLAMTAYSFSLHGSFLWDDDRHVEQNRGLRDADGLANIWTGHWRYLFATPEQRAQMRVQHPVYTPQYYPMTHTSYWLEYQFSGAQPNDINTTVFHIDNVILHVAGAILLWLVLRELAVPGAWLAAAIWALHPVNVESVAWISERKNVLAGVFYFGAMLAYVKWALRSDESKDWTLPGVAIVLFTLAVLSKTVACSLPAVLLLIVWWKRGRITRRDVIVTAPMFVIGIVLGLVTKWTESNYVGAEGSDYALSIVQRVLIAGNAVWFYLFKLLLPIKLTFIYPRWDVSASRPELWIGPIALVAVLGALFVLKNKIGRGPFVVALIFVGVLLPALGFVNFYPMRYSFVADHFQYLASAAVLTLLVAIGASIVCRITAAAAPKETPYVVAGVILIVLAILTARQASIYASPIDLWRDTVAKNPDSWMAHNSYGYALLRGANELPPERLEDRPGMLEQAAQQFDRTIQIKPDHQGAWKNWGEALLRSGKPREAGDKFQQALKLSSDNDLDAWMGLGGAQYDLKQYDNSLTSYRQAEKILQAMRPNAPRLKAATVYQSIARNLVSKSDLPGAAEAYKQSLEILPIPQTHFEYAELLAKQGKKADAAGQLGAAIRFQPDFIDARIMLAQLMMDVGNLVGATEQLRAASLINKEYPPFLEAGARLVKLVQDRVTTRPSTTRATTNPVDAAMHEIQKTRDITSEVIHAPATQPSK